MYENSARQIVEGKGHEFVNVIGGKFVIITNDQAEKIISLLGSCVGFFGYSPKISFATHINTIPNAKLVITQLKHILLVEFNKDLGDFKKTLSGGNNVNKFFQKAKLEDNIGSQIFDETIRLIVPHKPQIVHAKQLVHNKVTLFTKTGIISNHVGSIDPIKLISEKKI